MTRTQLFPGSREGKRRSVLFAIGIITCFIAIVAGASAYTQAPANWPVTVVLLVIGLAALIFSLLVYMGRFEGLVRDDQALWQRAE